MSIKPWGGKILLKVASPGLKRDIVCKSDQITQLCLSTDIRKSTHCALEMHCTPPLTTRYRCRICKLDFVLVS